MQYPSKRGFTLIEIMIVVVIIGLLAAAAVPTFNTVRKRSLHFRFMNDVRIFRDALESFYMETGVLPNDAATGTLDPQLAGYINSGTFTSAATIGGQWDIEVNDSGIVLGVGVVGYTISAAELLEIDTRFDDGNLATGRLQDIVAGSRYYWVIE